MTVGTLKKECVVSIVLQQNLGAFGDSIPGEDRTFGGNGFYIDMVPTSMWFVNVRAIVPPSHWKLISNYVAYRAHGQCEICGSSSRLEAHERWELDFEHKTARLRRLMCLCKLCHLSVHIGNAGRLGLHQTVEDHISLVTHWDKNEIKKHARESREVWQEASAIQWTPDMSIVETTGALIYSKDVVMQRVQEKREKAASSSNESVFVDFDGCRHDFCDQITAGDVVFVAKQDKDMLNGIPLLDIGPMYIVKSPSLLPQGVPSVSLREFLVAFKQTPVQIESDEQFQDILNRGQGPLRLVMTDINDDDAERLLAHGIVVAWK